MKWRVRPGGVSAQARPESSRFARLRKLSLVSSKCASSPGFVISRPVSRPTRLDTIGTQYVARSAPDGYTLLLVAGAFTTLPALSAQPTYDAVKDFAPISLMSQKPAVVMVNQQFEAEMRFGPATLPDAVVHAAQHACQIDGGVAGENLKPLGDVERNMPPPGGIVDRAVPMSRRIGRDNPPHEPSQLVLSLHPRDFLN
mgnify:CR=1 FL=1